MIGRPPVQFSGACCCVVVAAGPPVHSHWQSLMQVVVWPVGSCWNASSFRSRRVLGVDDVDAGDVGRAVRVRLTRLAARRAAVRARVARDQHELARLVDVHVLVLPERRLRIAARLGHGEVRRRIARQLEVLRGDLVQQLRVRRVGERVRLQPEAARDHHHVLAAVVEEVDRRGPLALRQRLDVLDVLRHGERRRRHREQRRDRAAGREYPSPQRCLPSVVGVGPPDYATRARDDAPAARAQASPCDGVRAPLPGRGSGSSIASCRRWRTTPRARTAGPVGRAG